MSRWITRAFVTAYGVDLDEAEGTLRDYANLEALFTRTLREGARPIDPDPDVMVSPVDGTCAAVGTTRHRQIQIAAGRSLSLDALLGEALDGERDVAVLYLSPRDYHRVHVPREGAATAWRYIAGSLWPVFPAAVRRVDQLFARNERAIVTIETDQGPLQVVLVGAFGVGRITLQVCDLMTNTGAPDTAGVLKPARSVERSDELGVFHLGSTVILVAPTDRWRWTIDAGDVVRVGRPIARREG